MTGEWTTDTRLQHFNTIYRNIVGHIMLCIFGQPVEMCCDLPSVVGQRLKMVKFLYNICGCCMMLFMYSFGQDCATMLQSSIRTSSPFNIQHVTTPHNRVVKCVQLVCSQQCAICCVQML